MIDSTLDGADKSALNCGILQGPGVVRIRAEPQLNQDRWALMGVQLALCSAQIIIATNGRVVPSKNGLRAVLAHQNEGTSAENRVSDLLAQWAAVFMEAQKSVARWAKGIDVNTEKEVRAEILGSARFLLGRDVDIIRASKNCLNRLARMSDPGK